MFSLLRAALMGDPWVTPSLTGSRLLTAFMTPFIDPLFPFHVSWAGWVWHRTSALQRALAEVRRGDSPKRVIEVLGQHPYVTGDVETNINWDEVWLDKTSGVRCVCQFHFFPPVTVCGESWVVGFDERSNAVSKYHIVSP